MPCHATTHAHNQDGIVVVPKSSQIRFKDMTYSEITHNISVCMAYIIKYKNIYGTISYHPTLNGNFP